MSGRLRDKVAVVSGGGQTAGQTIGNGRATAMLFAREGAKVVVGDRDLASAEETAEAILGEGGYAVAVEADVTDEAAVAAMIATATSRWGALDILHNNVGVSLSGGDAPVHEIEADKFAAIMGVNLGGMVLTCKHALAVMREQHSGAIVNISSMAAILHHPGIAYSTSKAAVIRLTEHVAVANADRGVRCNAIIPGLMDTPMAIENRVGLGGASREEVVAARNARVPLLGAMGTGWDVARAAVFLASDDASFVTGAVLTVDGGSSLPVNGG
jgi:NAD(P)-dependent dehydrogenase (short-subunit alcohol dehydrogenase family)